MELTEQSTVVVVLPFPWDEKPLWYQQCLLNIEYPDRQVSHMNVITQWFKTHYDADLCWRRGYLDRIKFPNQEAYMECVLTWS